MPSNLEQTTDSLPSCRTITLLFVNTPSKSKQINLIEFISSEEISLIFLIF